MIDYNLSQISFEDGLVQVPLLTPSLRQESAVTNTSVCIPAYSEMLVPIKIPKSLHLTGQQIHVERLPSFQFQRFAVAKSLSQCRGNIAVCQVLNINPFPVVLTKGTRVAKVENINSISSITPFNTTNRAVDHSVSG